MISIFSNSLLYREFTSNSIMKIDANISLDDGSKGHKITSLKFLDNENIVYGTDKGLIEVHRV